VAQIARLNKLIKIQEDNPKWKLKQKKVTRRKAEENPKSSGETKKLTASLLLFWPISFVPL